MTVVESEETMAARRDCAKEARETYWKMMTMAVTIILGLVGALWGITYGSLKGEVKDLKTSNIELVRFVAGQTEINKSINDKLEDIAAAVGAVTPRPK